MGDSIKPVGSGAGRLHHQRQQSLRRWRVRARARGRLTRIGYLLAKWCGNIGLLSFFWLCSCVVAMAAQVVRAEATEIKLIEFVWTYCFFYLPAIALTASAAILLDLPNELRHTVGNIVYAAIIIALFNSSELLDFLGYQSLQRLGRQEVSPLLAQGDRFVLFNQALGALTDLPNKRFVLTAWHPAQFLSWQALLGRVAWLAGSVANLFLAARFLDRAAARTAHTSIAFDAHNGSTLIWLSRLLQPLQRTQTGILLAAELLTILRTRPWWWWLLLVLAWGVQLWAPLVPGYGAVSLPALALVIGWVLLLDVFSRTLLRESETGTQSIIFTTIAANHKLLWVRCLVLVLLAWLCGLPLLLRCLLPNPAEPMIALNIVLLGISIPAIGMALGTLTRTPRLFELGLCTLGYGTYEHLPYINVVALSDGQRQVHVLLAVLALGSLPFLWRRLRGGR